MTVNIDTLREELEALDGNTLKTKARTEYGIKLLPEYKKTDIINLMLEVANRGGSTGVILAGDGPVKKGHARITLMDSEGEPDPFYICVNGYSATIPRNVPVEVPHEILASLNSMVIKKLIPNDDGKFSVVTKHRAPYTLHEVDRSSSGKLPYTERREKNLAPKRAYYAKYGYWPTDGELRTHVAQHGIKDLINDDVPATG